MTFSQSVRNFFVRHDPEYDAFIARHRAKTSSSKLGFLVLFLLPGLLARIAIFNFGSSIMSATGTDYRYMQFIVLIIMSIGWEIGLVFLLLRFQDKISFKDSLRFLGLQCMDVKGLFIITPIVLVLFSFLYIIYSQFIFIPVHAYLETIPALHLPDWAILKLGYFSFPVWLLIPVAIGNFVGEELYFRGYLQNKISGIWGYWAIGSLLFELYHMWQPSVNWAYAPGFLIIPFSIVVAMRKNIYPAILLHFILNIYWIDFLEQARSSIFK